MAVRDRRGRYEVKKTLVLSVLVVMMVSLFSGCSTISTPSTGTGTLWGYVTLKPPKGVNPFATSSDSYGDRRLRDIEFVDYRNLEFAVVYFEGLPPSPSTVELKLLQTQFGPRFNTAYSAVGLSGTIILRNEDRYGHVFSCREASLLARLEPGEQVIIPALLAKEYTVSILDDVDINTLTYVVPGPFSLASDNGRWELPDLPPGRGSVWAWHPGFPAVSRNIEVTLNSAQRVDLEIGVKNLPKIED